MLHRGYHRREKWRSMNIGKKANARTVSDEENKMQRRPTKS